MKVQRKICILLVLISLIDICVLDELENDILRSVNAAVTGSSQHSHQFALSHATDGSKSNISSCSCCAATVMETNPWIKIDLGRLYRVSRLEVMGRTDLYDIFSGMNIYIHITPQPANFTDKTIIPSVTRKYYNYTLAYPSIGQYVTLALIGNHLLCVCEVKVFSRDCSNGTFGKYCNETCGSCQAGEPCDHVTGYCNQCMPGYKMNNCKENCTIGSFGVDCASTCHCYDNETCHLVTGECPSGRCDLGWKGSNCSFKCGYGRYGENCSLECGICLNNETCDRKTGICRQCADGYREHLCNEKCLAVSFGVNCSSSCHCLDNSTCDHVNGSCPGNKCDFGWKDFNCSQECSAGTYGLNCSESCGQCLGDEVCNHVTGTCRQCDVGYKGDLCNDDCKDGTFGANCSSACNCHDNRTCDHVTGTCPYGWCDDGWQGLNCSSACPSESFGTNCSATCHCYNNRTCDHVIGNCPNNKCDHGWHGDNCSQECDNGTYGVNCRDVCGHCYNNKTCYKKSGKCWSCAAGYTGQYCKEECSNGSFGRNCSQTCGHCIDPCDVTTGVCLSGCQPGFTGPNCTTSCRDGYFGYNCNSTCGHCANNMTCNKTDGRCEEGCMDGFKEIQCFEECSTGKYGVFCNATCGHCANNKTCDHVTGYCAKCDAGYTEQFCTEKCPPGMFGFDCKTSCHCVNNTECDHVTGICPAEQCDPGWKRQNCSVECDVGTYGWKCSSVCHCDENYSCDHVSGECPNDTCAPGWNGDACSKRCGDGFYGQNCMSVCGHCADNTTCNKDNGQCEDGCSDGYRGFTCVQAEEHEQGPPPVSIPAAVGSTLAVVCIAAIIIVVVSRLQSTRLQWGKLISSDDDQEPIPMYAQVTKHNTRAHFAISETDQIDRKEFYTYIPQTIPVYTLWDYITQNNVKNNETILSEFMMLKRCHTFKSSVGTSDHNLPKNRYRGFNAYDHSRVQLETTDEEGSDYINANYIEGFERKRKFIAVQGPTTVMVNDFWLMVLQQQCRFIVMLTNVFEMGVRKCLQYWPDNGEVIFGDVTVTLQNEEEYMDYVIRYLEVKHNDGQILSVNQYHFKAWPDKDVPDNVWCLANFWRAVDSAAANVETSIVVHCSAGVGRTGTFIALDNMYYQAQATGAVCPFDVVKKLRNQRVKMVQTTDQFVYLHEVVAEALLFGTRNIDSLRFDELYLFMNTLEKDGMSKYTKQLMLIDQSIEDIPSTVEEESEYSNVAFSVDNGGRLQLQMDDGNATMEASYLPMVIGPKAGIIAKSPSPKDVEMFWTFINQLRIRTVVMTTSLANPHYQTSLCLGVTDERVIGDLTIQRLATEDQADIMTFTINDGFVVKQFHIPVEPDSPNSAHFTRELAGVVSSIVMWYSSQSSTEPILIHYSDGASSTSGIVAVVLNEILRMTHQDGGINIVETVKTMKQVNRNMITTAEQLKFCYDVIWSYFHMDDVYQNA